MLIKLLRTYIRPYKRPIAYVVMLQLVQTIATLYLPTLNADIIDNGVVAGDTGYILPDRRRHARRHARPDRLHDRRRLLRRATAMAVGRDLRAGIFAKVQSFSAREVGKFGAPSLITRTTNDVQQVQMLVLMTFTLMVAGADHVLRRHHHGAPAGRAAVVAAAHHRAGPGRARLR